VRKVIIVLSTFLWVLATAANAQPKDIISLNEYAKISHVTPYTLNFCKSKSRLRYLGVSHSNDPDSPTSLALQKAWDGFGPDLVLFEGGNSMPQSATFVEAVRSHGEAGGLVFLARAENVEVASLELPFAEEIRMALKSFSEDQVISFYALRIIAQERGQPNANSPDELLETRVLPWLARQGVLENPPLTVEKFSAIVRTTLPKLRDWRTVRRNWFDPLNPQQLFTIALARRLMEIRDEHMVKIIQRYMKENRRIFAVAGASHTVMQENRIRSDLSCFAKFRAKGAKRVSPEPQACDSVCSLN
jgi:hypothetical protein